MQLLAHEPLVADMPSNSDDNPITEQCGKRGDPAYAQVAGMIPLELRREFNALVDIVGMWRSSKLVIGILNPLIE